MVNLDIFNEIDSTNDEAKRIDIKKDFHVIVAEEQIQGRGRLGKKWLSPNSGNIYMTIATIKDLSFMPISLISGLICKNAINSFLNNSLIMLKWPNDIIYKKKKIGGILVETESSKDELRTIIGIGINFSIDKMESWWGDLSEFKLEYQRNHLINSILSEFIKIFENFSSDWKEQWMKSCIHMNKEIEIYKSESLQMKGMFKGIDDKGNAIVETKDGLETIVSGEISIKGVY